MKKLCLLCILCLCFVACGHESADIGTEEAAARILTEYERNAFVRADDDFIKTNFGTPDHLKEATVYYAANGDGTEFGFFRVADASSVDDMEWLIKDYLATERAAVESLAALYPADELVSRLARLDGAAVGHVGNTVYYCVADSALCQAFSKKLG